VPFSDWRSRVQDMLDSIEAIQSYTGGMTQAAFEADQRTIDAVVRHFIIIGEAASRIPVEVQQRDPNIAWRQIRGLRNVAVHEYSRVNNRVLWQTATSDLAALEAQLRTLLSREP
jgi:uncharacterized protein with HEPN domain